MEFSCKSLELVHNNFYGYLITNKKRVAILQPAFSLLIKAAYQLLFVVKYELVNGRLVFVFTQRRGIILL